jgi:hypothetical protein
MLPPAAPSVALQQNLQGREQHDDERVERVELPQAPFQRPGGRNPDTATSTCQAR